jgi:hypothetical protein
VIADIRDIFNGAIYAYSSNYINTEARKDGSFHKEKANIEAYHHFVNKITVTGIPYYIRFAVEELKSSGQLHSAHITGAEIINEKSQDETFSLPGDNPGRKVSLAYDNNLIEFLNSVKGESFQKHR